MTAFAIIRTHKHKHLASIVGVARHHAREVPCPSADTKMTPKNQAWGAGKSASQAVGDKVKQVIDDAQKVSGRKFRSDSVKAIEYLMTASPEFWKSATRLEKNGYMNKCRSWLEEKHGKGCVVAEWLHVDESSPHLHAIIVPLKDGVLNAKAFLGGKSRLRDLQTDFAKSCGEPFGLSRGLEGSGAKYVKATDWWAALNAPTPQPSKMDFAKAAVGIEVPAVDTVLMQSQALKAFNTSQHNVKRRIKRVDERERELAVQESFLGDKMKLSQRVSELERENETLKNKVRSLETPKPGTYVPGQSVGIR
jgi:hypothetical protein